MEPELPDDALPPPLVPADVDLTDFKFMPLEVGRLLRSEFWMVAIEEAPLVAAVSVNLWAASWHERPAASLPDSDIVLARTAMLPRSKWLEVKTAVMAPWVLCSDGRWYHPVVAEKALEAWAEKEGYRARAEAFSKKQSAKARNRWEKMQRHTQGNATEDAGGVPRHTHGNAAVMPMKGTGTGTEKGTGKEKKEDILSKAGASDPLDPVLPLGLPDQRTTTAPPPEPSEGYTAEFEAWWKLYPRRDAKGAAFKAFKLAKKRTTLDRLMAAVVAYAKRRKGEDPKFTKLPTTWLNGDCWNDEPETGPKKMPGGYVPFGVGG